MSRSIRRGAVAATLALALAPLAAACSSGTNAATGDLKPDTPHTALGTVKVQNLTLVAGDEGTDLVALGGAFINEGDRPETLAKVVLEGATGAAELRSAAGTGPITIPAHGAVYLTGGADKIVFKADDIRAGDYKKVTFSFGTVGETTLRVAVHLPEDYYKPLKPEAPATKPAAAPSASQSPSTAPSSAAPSTTPSAPASGTPTGAATATSGAPTASGTATGTARASSSGTPAAG